MSKEAWNKFVAPSVVLAMAIGVAACTSDKATQPQATLESAPDTTVPTVPTTLLEVAPAAPTVPYTIAAPGTYLELPGFLDDTVDYVVGNFIGDDGPGMVTYNTYDSEGGTIFVIGAKAHRGENRDLVWEEFCLQDGSGLMHGVFSRMMPPDYAVTYGYDKLPVGDFPSSLCTGPVPGVFTVEQAAAEVPNVLPHP